MKTFGTTGTSNGHGYSNGHDGHAIERRPGDIEEEIQMTRARMQSTIEAIKKDLSPGQIVDQVMHSLKDGKVHDVATSTFSSVGHVVRQNPLPAALIGVGIVWLAASSNKKSQPISARSARSYVEGSGGEGDYGRGLYSEGELYSEHDERAGFAGQRTEGTYGGSMESYEGVEEGEHEGRLSQAKEHAKEKVGSIAHGARSKIGNVGGKIGGVAQGARAKVSGVTHGAAHRVSGAASYTKQKATAGAVRAKQVSVETFDAQPLVIGAIAIGVGALLGALIPSTQREDQLLGAKRDQLKRKADEAGAQVLGRVKETVEQGAQKVKGRLEEVEQRAQQRMQQTSAERDVGNVGNVGGAMAGGVAGASLGVADLGNVEPYPTQASSGTFANRGDVEVKQQSGPQATLDDGDAVDDPDTFGGP